METPCGRARKTTSQSLAISWGVAFENFSDAKPKSDGNTSETFTPA